MVLYVVMAVVATVVIALVAVGREAFTLGFRPKEALFDLDEAVDFVADRLPHELTARMSYDEVRQILDLYIGYLRDREAADDDQWVVVEDDEAVAYILGQDEALDAHDVFAVVQGGHAYLEAIGAVGGEV